MENVSQTSVLEKNQRWPRKRYLAVIFVSFLLGTPVNIALASTYLHIDQNMMIMMLIIGTLGSGFTMAKIFAKKIWVFWTLGIVFSILVGVLYAGAFIALIAYAFAHGGVC